MTDALKGPLAPTGASLIGLQVALALRQTQNCQRYVAMSRVREEKTRERRAPLAHFGRGRPQIDCWREGRLSFQRAERETRRGGKKEREVVLVMTCLSVTPHTYMFPGQSCELIAHQPCRVRGH